LLCDTFYYYWAFSLTSACKAQPRLESYFDIFLKVKKIRLKKMEKNNTVRESICSLALFIIST
jgi:hypothetical protein